MSVCLNATVTDALLSRKTKKKMAKAAQAALSSGSSSDEDYLKTKLVTAKFFMERILPETALRKTRIEAGADTMMELAAEAF